MEQRTNFVLFIVICLTIFIGWIWLQNQIWPPKQKDPKQDAAKKKKEEKKDKPQPQKVIAKPGTWWFDLAEGDQQAVLTLTAAGLRVAGASSLALPSWNQVAAAIASQPWKAEELPLGGKDFFLEAVLTTRGAGVRKVTLTHFKAADSLGRPQNQDLELVQDDPEMASYLLYHYPEIDAKNPHLTLGRAIWHVENGATKEKVVFWTHVPNYPLKIIKTYELQPKEYHIRLTLEIRNLAKDAKKFRYQLAGAHGLPIEGEWYTGTYRNAVIGMANLRGSLWRELEDAPRISQREGGDRVPEGDRGERFVQYAGVMNQYFAALIVVDDKHYDLATRQEKKEKILAWARPTLETTEQVGKILAIAGSAVHLQTVDKEQAIHDYHLLPRAKAYLDEKNLTEGEIVVVSYYETGGRRIGTWIRRGKALQAFRDDITVRVNSEAIELAAGDAVRHQFLLYHGPAKTRLLADFGGDQAVDSALVQRYTDTLHLRSLTDYGKFWWWTDILIACTKLMHLLLYFLHLIVPDWGLSIILLTVVVRGLMFPISRKQALLMMRMQELAPELKKLQEKYKNDRQAKTEAMMAFYRQHGVNPFGGCLPLLMQLPIFLGLYFALQESIHFRQARFLWIPSLSAPDMLLWWGENIPLISDPDNQGPGNVLCFIPLNILYLGPYLNVLPIFAIFFMIVQQKLMTPPAQDEQQAMQQKMLKWMMIVFGIMFFKVAAGLCLYFIASSVWGVAERKLLPKKKNASAASAETLPPPAKGFRAKRRGLDKDKKEPDGTFQKLKNWWGDFLKKAKKK